MGDSRDLLIYPPELFKLGGAGSYRFDVSACYSYSRPSRAVTSVSEPRKGTVGWHEECVADLVTQFTANLVSTQVGDPVIEVISPMNLDLSNRGKTISVDIMGANLAGKKVGGTEKNVQIRMRSSSISAPAQPQPSPASDNVLNVDVPLSASTLCGPHPMILVRSLPGQGLRSTSSAFNLHRRLDNLVVVEGENYRSITGDFNLLSDTNASGTQVLTYPQNKPPNRALAGEANWAFMVPQSGDYRIFLRSKSWRSTDVAGGSARLERRDANGAWQTIRPNDNQSITNWSWRTTTSTNLTIGLVDRRNGGETFSFVAGDLYRFVVYQNKDRDMPQIDMVMLSRGTYVPKDRDICF